MKPCPTCGSPRRVRYVEGTRIEIGLAPCPDEYCEEGGGRRRRHESSQAVARLIGSLLGCVLIFFLSWCALTISETMQRNACDERDGTYVPIRGILVDWPTGMGTCTP